MLLIRYFSYTLLTYLIIIKKKVYNLYICQKQGKVICIIHWRMYQKYKKLGITILHLNLFLKKMIRTLGLQEDSEAQT